jgi:hypothetical protein
MQTPNRSITAWHWMAVALVVFGLSACTATGGNTPATTAPTLPASTAIPTTLAATSTAVQTASLPAATATSGSSAQAASYADPFSYCSAVGTIDVPDSRYTGPAIPDAIAQGLKTASGAAADAPIDIFKQGSYWRCMGGKVYACFVGANLPCDSKADTDKTPTSAETDYCTSNPNSDFIPAAVTGHNTIYSWRCNQNTPAIDKQVFNVDSQGYIQEIWYQLNPQ